MTKKHSVGKSNNQLAPQTTYTVNTKNETQNVKITFKTNRYYIIYDKPEQKQQKTKKNINYEKITTKIQNLNKMTE